MLTCRDAPAFAPSPASAGETDAAPAPPACAPKPEVLRWSVMPCGNDDSLPIFRFLGRGVPVPLREVNSSLAFPLCRHRGPASCRIILPSRTLHEPPGCCPARRGAREQPPPRAAHARVLRPFVPIFGPAFSALPCNLQAGNVYSSSNSMRNCVSRCIQSCSSVPRQPPRAAPRSAGASMVTGGTDDRRCYDTSCGFWN